MNNCKKYMKLYLILDNRMICIDDINFMRTNLKKNIWSKYTVAQVDDDSSELNQFFEELIDELNEERKNR